MAFDMGIIIDSYKAFVKLNDEIKNLTEEMNTTTSTVNSFSGSVFEASKEYLKLSTLHKGLTSNLSEAMEFEKSIARLGTKTTNMDILKPKILSLGLKTPYSPNEIAGGMDTLASGNFNSKAMESETEKIIKLATIANMGLSETADIVASTIGGFKLNAQKTEEVVNSLATTVQKAGLGLDSLGVTFNTVTTETKRFAGGIGDFNNTEGGVENITALSGALIGLGKSGRVAGNIINDFYFSLSNPSLEAKDWLNAHEIEIEAKSMIEVFGQLSKAMSSIGSDDEKLNITKKIFGDKAGYEAFDLIKHYDNLKKLYGEIQNTTTKDINELNEKLTNNVATSTKLMRNNLDYLQIEVSKDLMKPLNEELKGVNQSFVDISKNTDFSIIGRELKGVVGGVDELALAYGAFQVGKPIVEGIVALVSHMRGLKGVTKSINKELKGLLKTVDNSPIIKKWLKGNIPPSLLAIGLNSSFKQNESNNTSTMAIPNFNNYPPIGYNDSDTTKSNFNNGLPNVSNARTYNPIMILQSKDDNQIIDTSQENKFSGNSIISNEKIYQQLGNLSVIVDILKNLKNGNNNYEAEIKLKKDNTNEIISIVTSEGNNNSQSITSKDDCKIGAKPSQELCNESSYTQNCILGQKDKYDKYIELAK